MATVLIEAGIDADPAQSRAEDALIAIQGALMLSQGLDDATVFQRVIQHLPQTLLAL